MARQYQAVEVNKFTAGLITDASPLTSVDNSSLEEDNFVLNIDGSRNRRLGIDYEVDYEKIDSGVSSIAVDSVAVTSFKWDNAGGRADRNIEVVQIGQVLKFFLLGGPTVSGGLIHTATIITPSVSAKCSYAVVDGILIVVNGSKLINRFEFDPDTNVITTGTSRLLVRDFFGVEDIFDGEDIARGSAVQNRPLGLTQAHLYNLRNQSFGVPRVASNTETTLDPIRHFDNVAVRFPANSDTVTEALYADPADTDNRTVERFFAADLFKNPLGTSRAPMGYFIIDALDRGASRIEQDLANRIRYNELNAFYGVEVLPNDITPSGATVVTEFAGRVWYAGFPGEVIDGDEASPKMSAYVLFSKVVDSPADITSCYQEGDPTSSNGPDILSTDGGFLRLNEAYGIQKLVNIGSSLVVIATNGVWRIVGGSDTGFTAETYIIEKISDRGCTSPNSVVRVENSVMFWSDDSIYHIMADQFGSYGAKNISYGRIQSFYDNIDVGSKRNCVGEFDSYERKVRWLYDNQTISGSDTRELVLDVQLQAFYSNTIKGLGGLTKYPKAVSIYRGLPYQLNETTEEVLVGVDDVLITSLDQVLISATPIESGQNQRELGYLVITGDDPDIEFTFAKYSNRDFRDWFSEDNVGVDAEAYMITNYMSGGDFQRDKGVSYIIVHLRRTETGYFEDMSPRNPSSCLVQARWGWANGDNSGKWGREFQAYRYRRLYLPLNDTDNYDNGFLTISSRNKLRGNGKVLSLRFRTEPYHDLHLYGWSMVFNVSENV